MNLVALVDCEKGEIVAAKVAACLEGGVAHSECHDGVDHDRVRSAFRFEYCPSELKS